MQHSRFNLTKENFTHYILKEILKSFWQWKLDQSGPFYFRRLSNKRLSWERRWTIKLSSLFLSLIIELWSLLLVSQGLFYRWETITLLWFTEIWWDSTYNLISLNNYPSAEMIYLHQWRWFVFINRNDFLLSVVTAFLRWWRWFVSLAEMGIFLGGDNSLLLKMDLVTFCWLV